MASPQGANTGYPPVKDRNMTGRGTTIRSKKVPTKAGVKGKRLPFGHSLEKINHNIDRAGVALYGKTSAQATSVGVRKGQSVSEASSKARESAAYEKLYGTKPKASGVLGRS